MFTKYIKAFFDNIKYIPDGLSEMATPIERLINNIYNSTMFRVLYFIPIAVLKLISIILNWYYNNFMSNEATLQSAANRVIFIYLIPAAVIVGIIILLTKNDSRGWELLFISPIIIALFPLFEIYWICCIISKIRNYQRNTINKKKNKITDNPPNKIKEIKDEGLKRSILGETVLEYALKKTFGHKKILTNLYLPLNNKGINKYIKVDAVLINKYGIFVWDAKCPLSAFIFYGKKYDEIWYQSNELYTVKIVEDMLETGERDYRVKTFLNPLRHNRMRVNMIQKQLKLNGIANAHMFSGIAFMDMDERSSYVECGADEKVCDVNNVPKVIKLWGKMSKTLLNRKDINKIFSILSRYTKHSDEVKKIYTKNLQEKYGVQSEDEINVNKLELGIFGAKEKIMKLGI
jgi:hypothetical protein